MRPSETDRPERPWLTRNLKAVSLVSFLQDAASDLLYPILPIFITSVLGAPAAVIGLIEGLADGMSALLKLISGRLADRRRRRPLIAIGYSLSAGGKALIAVATWVTVWPIVLGARLLDRFGKGMRGSPRDALIADSVAPEHLGRAFGFHRAADSAGAVVGPLLGLSMFELFNHHYRPVFLFALVPAVLSALAVAFVHEAPHPLVGGDGTATDAVGGQVLAPKAPLPKAFWRPFTILTAFALVNFTDALLILRAKELGLSVTAVIVVYALYNAVYALGSYPAGALADRLSKETVVATGFVIFAISYVGLGVIRSAALVWPILALYGLYTALTDGVAKAWVSASVPREVRGRALGLQGGAAGVGSIIAGLWAGLAWHGTGSVPLVVAGSGAALLALATVARPRGARPRERVTA